jgi:Autographiviridae endonuclease VII
MSTGWKTHLRKNYGMNELAYELRFKQQRGKCAICKNTTPKRRLCVDHDHRTQEIRGLLCTACNRGLGFFQDEPEILKAAIRYLGASPF